MKSEVRYTKNKGIEIPEFEILNDDKTRSLIALSVLGVCFIFLVGAAAYSLWQGNFIALKEVMKYVSTLIGTIAGYYFGVKGAQDNH